MKYIDYTTSTVFVQLLNQFDRMFDSILYLRTVLIGYCHNILYQLCLIKPILQCCKLGNNHQHV